MTHNCRRHYCLPRTNLNLASGFTQAVVVNLQNTHNRRCHRRLQSYYRSRSCYYHRPFGRRSHSYRRCCLHRSHQSCYQSRSCRCFRHHHHHHHHQSCFRSRSCRCCCRLHNHPRHRSSCYRQWSLILFTSVSHIPQYSKERMDVCSQSLFPPYPPPDWLEEGFAELPPPWP